MAGKAGKNVGIYAGCSSKPTPRLATVVLSLLVHSVAVCAAVMVVTPPVPPPMEPQPMAVMVEFVTDPTVEDEERQEVRKGEPDLPDETDAAPEETVVEEPKDKQPEEALVADDTPPEPDSIPIPLRRPKPEKLKSAKTQPDKKKLAKARGLEDDPLLDIVLGEALKALSAHELAVAAELSRGMRRNIQAEERWHMQLTAHLERCKRYPSRALSRRMEGVVQVRFLVEPDGVVMFPELVRSSGVAELDEEVMDLVQRASPVPKPPPGVNNFVTVPVSFTIKS